MPVSFKNILIAGRGEIALRIIRTLRNSGIQATGVYTENDRHSPWIEQCNQAWSLGEGNLAETYLNIEKIISLALKAGADAIHPGYGFLSENPAFAEACSRNKIVFIGPSSEILKIAGNKQSSHELARSLGIPVIAQQAGTIDELLSKSDEILYPVLAKAVAGGGGKGIRIIRNSQELELILQTVSGEARNYFGDERIYIEQLVQDPRHIEIQILGDIYGNIIHLFERECSIQRRHQKLIEESPAISQSQGTLKRITDAALKIARGLRYYSAGTVEFLIDKYGNYYFLEINPRIQVEHGVTELVTGLDIVREQINIASGNKLSVRQEDIQTNGHSIEARIYSEDIENNLIPCPGQIHYIFIPETDGVRMDSSVINGSQILPDFDPLIAKIMVHCSSRDQAIELMNKVLDETIITGLPHNVALHKLIFCDAEFVRNDISVNWVENKLNELTIKHSKRKQATDTFTLAVTAALIILFRNNPAAVSPWITGHWRNVGQIRFRFKNRIIELDYSNLKSNSADFHFNESFYPVTQVRMDEYKIEFNLNGQVCRLYTLPETEEGIRLSDGHIQYNIERFKVRQDAFIDNNDGVGIKEGNTVFAPQPGTIIEIKVTEGQKVSRGDYLLTIESMKLENNILAVSAGIIRKINIKAGDRVKKNEPLIHLQDSITN